LEQELEEALNRGALRSCEVRIGFTCGEVEGLGEEVPASAARVTGHRNGRREREVVATFGEVTIVVPRALAMVRRGTRHFRRTDVGRRKSKLSLPAAYLAGTNTRRIPPSGLRSRLWARMVVVEGDEPIWLRY
jgi:hypothetical protein